MPVYASYVLQFPLPLQLAPPPFHRPRPVGVGADLDHVLALSLRVLRATDQVNVMTFCRVGRGGREREREKERERVKRRERERERVECECTRENFSQNYHGCTNMRVRDNYVTLPF